MKTEELSRTDSVEMAFDRYVCYPNESATLYLHCRPGKNTPAALFVKLPQTAEIISDDENQPNWMLVSKDNENAAVYCTPISETDSECDYSLKFRLNDFFIDHYLNFSSWIETGNSKIRGVPQSANKVRLAVKSEANYLKYLPELYSDDDFMNRFLMFFESFWKPISQQIGQIENYFDPDMTPDVFIPWLASWLGLEIDDTFPEERKRKLIKSAISFYHSRGTIRSLKTFLEMYSGGDVHVRELKAKNMILGRDSFLGESIALGHRNQPNTVEIKINADHSELERTGFTEEVYCKKVKELIRKIVPAHTIFILECKFN